MGHKEKQLETGVVFRLNSGGCFLSELMMQQDDERRVETTEGEKTTSALSLKAKSCSLSTRKQANLTCETVVAKTNNQSQASAQKRRRQLNDGAQGGARNRWRRSEVSCLLLHAKMNHFKEFEARPRFCRPFLRGAKMTVNKPSCRATTMMRLAMLGLVAICSVLVGLAAATNTRTQREVQRVPRGLSVVASGTVRSLVADGGDASKQVSDSNLPAPLWSGGNSKNVNHPGWAHSTDSWPTRSAHSINHLHATASRRRLDKSNSISADTTRGSRLGSQPMQFNHHNRARRSPQTSGAGLVVSPPKLVQWSREPVQYHEGSTLVLSCSLSYAGGEQAPLIFAWFKQGKPLMMTSAGQLPMPSRLSIETRAEYSLLRLADLRPADSGAYTCVVGNSLNQEDRTSMQVIVNVKLKWLAGAQRANTSSTTVGNGHQLERARAGQSVAFECNAAGGGQSQSPRVRWFRLIRTSNGPTGPTTTSGLTSSDNLAHPSRFRLGQSGSSSHRSDSARPPDETQLRSSLIQLDSAIGYTPSEGQPYRRIELVRDNEMLQHGNELPGTNGSHHKQPKWHIETNPGASFVSLPNQQHEVYSKLVLDRLDPDASGLYECEVIASLSQSSHSDSTGLAATASGDKLGRVFGLLVNGK